MTYTPERGSESSYLQPTEGSALQNVFGSQVSLAELSGDVASARVSRRGSPLPRLGSSAADFTMSGSPLRTQVLRAQAGSVQQRPPARALQRLSRTALAARILVIFCVGAGNGRILAHWVEEKRFEMVFGGVIRTVGFMVASGIMAVVLGLLLPAIDYKFPEPHVRGKSGDDWLSIIRAAVAFLGLGYAVTKLAGAGMFWGLVSPCFWYVVDATRNGLLLSTATAILGVVSISCVSDLSHLSWPQIGRAHAAIAAAGFTAGLCFGNLGRRLLSPHPEQQSVKQRTL